MATCLIPSRLDLRTQNLFSSLLTPQAVIWLSHNYNAVKCWWDMGHFNFQLRQKPQNICDPASSNHHNSGMIHGKNNFSQPY